MFERYMFTRLAPQSMTPKFDCHRPLECHFVWSHSNLAHSNAYSRIVWAAKPLPQQVLIERSHTPSGNERSLKLRNIPTAARDADAVADVWLQVDVRRGRDELYDLAAFVEQRKLRCAGPFRDHWP